MSGARHWRVLVVDEPARRVQRDPERVGELQIRREAERAVGHALGPQRLPAVIRLGEREEIDLEGVLGRHRRGAAEDDEEGADP